MKSPALLASARKLTIKNAVGLCVVGTGATRSAKVACATMVSRTYSWQVPYGVIQCDGNEIRGITEKPRSTCFVSAGIYVLNPPVISLIEKENLMDMPDVFERLIQQGEKLLSYPLTEYWMDIGQLDDFERAQTDYEELFGENQ